jgi:hypothetical protein
MITILAISVTSLSLIACLLLAIRVRNLKREAKFLIADKLKAEELSNGIRAEEREHHQMTLTAKVRSFRSSFDNDNSSVISQAFAGPSLRSFQERAKDMIEQKFGKMAQDFLGGIVDEAEGLARDLNIELCEKIWDAFQGFKEMSKESPTIFANNTKLAYTKGSRSVIVIEQNPQVRTVSFTPDLIDDKAVAKEAQGKTEHGLRYSLAFPYVYFMVVFDGGKYHYHEVYFRNKPLTSVREHVYLAPLPNVWVKGEKSTNNAMCMGNDHFAAKVGDELTVARQCEMVVSHFWQRTFNQHLGDGNPGVVDKRIKNYAVWQAHSQKDPLFVLDVSWQKGKTIKGIVEAALERRSMKHGLDAVDTHIREKLTSGVAKLTERIKSEIATAKKKHGKGIFTSEQQVAELAEQLMLGHAKRVFDHFAKTIQ